MLTNHPPMTAAERQRRCRARGKGRHRGGQLSQQMGDQAARQLREILAAAAAADAAAKAPQPQPEPEDGCHGLVPEAVPSAGGRGEHGLGYETVAPEPDGLYGIAVDDARVLHVSAMAA